MVRIITDSTADISAENAKKLGITVLPLTIHFGEETYRDGVDITNKEFYDKLATVETLPTTAQIPPAVFADTFKKYIDEGDEIVCLLIASKLSGTRQSAIIAADIAMKASGAEIGFVDRFSGTLIVTGTVSEVEAALRALCEYTRDVLGFTVCNITKT